MKAKLLGYALAMGARKNHLTHEEQLTMAGFTFNARSPEEAIGKGIKIAQKEWPQDEGWTGHFCVVCEVPEPPRPHLTADSAGRGDSFLLKPNA